MPAQAGIQEYAARAFGLASWIPGLALLARNDGAVNTLRISCVLYLALSRVEVRRSFPCSVFVNPDNKALAALQTGAIAGQFCA